MVKIISILSIKSIFALIDVEPCLHLCETLLRVDCTFSLAVFGIIYLYPHSLIELGDLVAESFIKEKLNRIDDHSYFAKHHGW